MEVIDFKVELCVLQEDMDFVKTGTSKYEKILGKHKETLEVYDTMLKELQKTKFLVLL